MRQPEEVRVFKNELSNYNEYKTRVAKLQDLIDYCYHMLGGVSAVDPSKEPIHGMPNKDMEYKIRDEIEHHEQNKARTQAKIDEIDETLARIDIGLRGAIIEVFANHNKTSYVAQGMYLSETGLRKRMNKAIKKALTI